MASKSEILNEIEALSVHCRPPLMEANHRTSWLQDWCADLAEYPIEAIRIACRKWRLSGATKFPTPGQLVPSIRENLPAEKREINREWSPVDDETYREMSIRDKIREHQILAQQAYRKAGPMFRNGTLGGEMSKASGTHLSADEMPSAYRHWIAEAQRHTAEASRLRKLISGESQRIAAE
jgi:hypothetical protein